MTDVFYKDTNYYPPYDEHCIRWDSSSLAINWLLSGTYPCLCPIMIVRRQI
ncbi:hypothetical protein ACLHZ0_07810 [Aeromonas salmonicida]|uniref:hypothetical protein n=1 Tax=Aeromonas salmonicida TaxID=645 RepID=UPI003D04EBAA